MHANYRASGRVALFLRVSTDEQTADNQRPNVEHLARARGFDVVATYQETATGAQLDRAQLAAMLEAAHRRAFEIVIVWALDRLGPSMFETRQVDTKMPGAITKMPTGEDPYLIITDDTHLYWTELTRL